MVREGLERLRCTGRVYYARDAAERNRMIAELYTTLPGESLVVCATNEERRAVNEAVRAARVERGEVEATGFQTEVYLNKNVTRASRKEARHYERGNVMRFARVRHGALRAGVWYTVVGRDLLHNRVTVRGPGGERITYDPGEHFGIEDVFAVERRLFAAGDKVQLRGTERSAGVRSGDLATVVSVDGKGRIMLRTRGGLSKVLDLGRYKTLDHAYASTGHSAQSRTVDNTIVLQPSGHRREVVNQASVYVGASRTRGELFLVVDDFGAALEGMEREYEKAAALDVAGSSQTPARRAERGLGLALEPSGYGGQVGEETAPARACD
jgi:hypothetical protein